jgi:hypothetical protein
MPAKTLTVALKNYFGYREGEGLTGFAAEIKKLSNEDKEELKTMLKDEGIDVA